MNITPTGRQRRRCLRSAGAVLLAVAGLGLTACSAGSSEGSPAAAASGPATTPASAEGPVLVTGTVSRDGEPLPDTPVLVQIWPEEEVEVGATVDLHDVGPVRTDEHGRYTVALDREDLAAEYFVGGDIVNFDVGVVDPFISSISTSAEYAEDGSWTDVGDGTGPRTMDFDLGTMKATETHGDGSTSRWQLIRLG